MKRALVAVVPLLLILPFGAGNRVAQASSSMVLKAQLKGGNEVGKAGPKNGTGTATITVTMSSLKLCYNLKVSGFKLPAIAAHIHTGKAGKNGPVIVGFATAPDKKGKASGCRTVNSSILKGITNHPTSYYVNVHSAAYPDGAVRGQLGM